MDPQLRLTRRTLLAGAGASAALVACGGSGGASPEPSPSSSTEPPPAQGDPVGAALEAVGVDAPVRLTPILFAPELLTGDERALQFGLIDVEQQAQPNLDLDVWFVAPDGTVAAGPYQPTFYVNERIPFTGGIYHAEVTIADPGTYDMILATRDRSVAGSAAVQLVAPEDSAVPAPGRQVPSVVTPTFDDPQDLEQLCTRDPDCSMHEMSLDAALRSGRAIVLTVATPAYCTTALCGPVVDDVESVYDELHEAFHRDVGSHDDGFSWLDGPVFIHAEVFKDAGNTPTPIVEAFGLPSEPWTWLIAPGGTVLERWGGPLIPAVLRAHLDEICDESYACFDAAKVQPDPSEASSDASSESADG